MTDASSWITTVPNALCAPSPWAGKIISSPGPTPAGDRAAAMYTLIGTAKLNGLDPEAYLRTLLNRIADHPIQRIHHLLPWNLSHTHS
jgi:hypothetical protein